MPSTISKAQLRKDRKRSRNEREAREYLDGVKRRKLIRQAQVEIRHHSGL